MTENESNEEKLEQRRTEGCPDELAPVESKKAADKSFPVVGLGASAGGQGYQRISGANSASGYCGKTQSLAHRPILKIPCQDQKNHASAVILSGTGTDGTIGIREIKAHDGLVLWPSPGKPPIMAACPPAPCIPG